MLPHCPKCMTQLLVAVDGTRASTGAAALRCPSCSGFWVPPEVVLVATSVELLGKLDTHPQQALGEVIEVSDDG